MKTGILLKRTFAILCTMLLMISLFAVPAFAEGTDTAEGTTAVEETTTTEPTGETEAVTEAGTTNNTTTTTTTKKGLEPTAIVFICIGGALVIAGVVFGIKYREKVRKFLRVYKSESKKVVWLSWDQTKKSTLVVLIVLVIAGAVICLVDLGLSKGLLAFLGLFNK